MEYLILGLGQARVLVVDPHGSTGGKGVGYGNLVRHVQQGFEAAHGWGTTLCLLPSRRPRNEAVLRLASPDVATLDPDSWQAGVLRAVWMMAAPFRHGLPGRWPLRLVAAAVRKGARSVQTRGRASSASSLPRRWMKRADRAEKWARAVEQDFAGRAERRWNAAFKECGRTSRERLRSKGLDGVRVALPPALARRAREQAEAAGIPVDRPMVVLHVREAGYGRMSHLRQRPLDDRRNSTIATYEAAMRRLTARGYVAVRIGDSSMTPVAWDGVVDLATARYRTDLLELWCVLRSKFFVASDSGPYYLTRLANLPCLAANVLQVGYHIARSEDRFICKRARNRSTGHILSIAEMLAPEYMTHGLDPTHYDQVDNTPDDLADAVTDMIAVVDGDRRRSPAQAAYDRCIAGLATHWSKSSRSTSLVVRRNALGTISRTFADRYFDAPVAGAAIEQDYGHFTAH